jgi:hypothetical protein
VKRFVKEKELVCRGGALRERARETAFLYQVRFA